MNPSEQSSPVSRRVFLASGLAAATALATAHAAGGGRLPAQPRREERLSLAVKYGMIKPGATVLEKFQLLAKLGYDGVELDAPGGPPSAEVVEAQKQTGIKVPG